MAAESSNILFDDTFTIDAIDKEGKKFDRVSRLQATSKNYGVILTIDYNNELLPLHEGNITVTLASSLQGSRPADGDEEVAGPDWRPNGKEKGGLEKDYDYVMYGKVYKFQSSGLSETATVYVSFGGLLMSLEGAASHLVNIMLGNHVYLLMRK